MIPGPVEVSPAVLAAYSVPPPGHLTGPLIEAFGASLEGMREVWRAEPESQPFVVAGSGTTAMEMAAANLVEPGEAVVVVHTGYFSDRMEQMLRRLGADLTRVGAPPGEAPAPGEIEAAVGGTRPKVLFATHVDTSTGVRVDPESLAALARRWGALSVFDGVCATAAERFEMAAWGADVYLTGSQKAIGLPPGLALMVVSRRALEARSRKRVSPPLSLDWAEWLPILRAYEERRPAYFATPATNLIVALEVGLREVLEHGIDHRLALHRRAARAMRAAWEAMGLEPVPLRKELQSVALSALRYPKGVDASLVARVAERGVIVAGGLHPAIRDAYFRVGHMGYAVTRPEMLLRTVEAIEAGLIASGVRLGQGEAVRAAAEVLGA
jgi:alanine-glyoxylate transaminase/serine-glyoxylate transaminase/serine-pyruvate transaminase